MRLTWQNLGRGWGWREGRAWLWSDSKRDPLRFEWAHPGNRSFALTWTGYGRGSGMWVVHVALWFGSWWLGRGGQDSWGRQTGVTMWGDWLRLFWRQQQPDGRGAEWSVHLLDLVLGRTRYTEGAPTLKQDILIPMPERGYHGTVELRRDSWKRPRWFRKVIRRASVEMLKGEQVPVPGKGENSWDCDEDAIFGMTLPAETVADAVAAMRDSALRTRERHGGPNWRPEARESV